MLPLHQVLSHNDTTRALTVTTVTVSVHIVPHSDYTVSPARQRDNDSHYETESIFVLILISKTQTK